MNIPEEFEAKIKELNRSLLASRSNNQTNQQTFNDFVIREIAAIELEQAKLTDLLERVVDKISEALK